MINKKCLSCQTLISVANWQIRSGRGLYCSPKCRELGRFNRRVTKICRTCKSTFTVPKCRLRGREVLYCSIACRKDRPDIGYWAIHKWLTRVYGKASKCENPSCKKQSKIFQWAKIREKDYLRDRACFIELCRSCHTIYDKKLLPVVN